MFSDSADIVFCFVLVLVRGWCFYVDCNTNLRSYICRNSCFCSSKVFGENRFTWIFDPFVRPIVTDAHNSFGLSNCLYIWDRDYDRIKNSKRQGKVMPVPVPLLLAIPPGLQLPHGISRAGEHPAPVIIVTVGIQAPVAAGGSDLKTGIEHNGLLLPILLCPLSPG